MYVCTYVREETPRDTCGRCLNAANACRWNNISKRGASIIFVLEYSILYSCGDDEDVKNLTKPSSVLDGDVISLVYMLSEGIYTVFFSFLLLGTLKPRTPTRRHHNGKKKKQKNALSALRDSILFMVFWN